MKKEKEDGRGDGDDQDAALLGAELVECIPDGLVESSVEGILAQEGDLQRGRTEEGAQEIGELSSDESISG